MSSTPPSYDPNCRQCPRLAGFLETVKQEHPDYFCAPVPAFGDDRAPLIIVGLAPGMHGANATGRPFTGDFAGVLLYDTLHRFGWTNRPQSESAQDGLSIERARITNAVKCLPPQNKPVGAEIRTCNGYLSRELALAPDGAVVVALGRIAHDAVLMALGLKRSAYAFGHGAEHRLERLWLIDSYHCSRYNTQTKRLTESMFHAVFERASTLLGR
ncbi:MAG: uracil-DNA glycosylase [Gammaproteobacteria bacterium]